MGGVVFVGHIEKVHTRDRSKVRFLTRQERLANKQTRTLVPKDSSYWRRKTQEWNGAEELRKRALERRV